MPQPLSKSSTADRACAALDERKMYDRLGEEIGRLVTACARQEGVVELTNSWRCSMSQSGLTTAGGIFEIEQQGDTLIVVPTVDLRELEYERIEDGASGILDLLNGTGTKNVVLDFYKTDYYGSIALGFFLKLLKRVRVRNGHMAFCNVSDHEKEILQITHLDHSWPICTTRSEALEVVKSQLVNRNSPAATSGAQI